MSHYATTSTLPLTALLLAIPAGAAAPAQQGPESSLAVATSYSKATRTTGTDDELQMSSPPDPSQQAGPPEPFEPNNYPLAPDYSLSKIFGTDSTYIEINAMCSGNAQLPPLDANGWPDLAGFGSWMSVTVSVDNDALGLPYSIIENRNEPGPGRSEPGADLITYYAVDSEGLSQDLPGNMLLAQSAEDLGLGGQSVVDVDALDFGTGVLSESQNSRGSVLFPVKNRFFFSLTPASATAVNNANNNNNEFAWYEPDPALPGYYVAADSRTVYEVEWDPGSGTWSSPPTVHRHASVLGLVAGDDIDGLAVDLQKGSVVFSTQPVPNRSQLMIQGKLPNGNNSVTALVDTDMAKVTTELGLRDPAQFTASSEVDNIDAICVIEPEQSLRDYYMAIPRARYDASSDGIEMGLSVTRWSTDLDVSERMVLQATLSGGLAATGGSLEFMYAVDCTDPTYPGTCNNWVSFPMIEVLPGTTSVPLATDLPWWFTSGDVMVTARMWDSSADAIIGSTWISHMKL